MLIIQLQLKLIESIIIVRSFRSAALKLALPVCFIFAVGCEPTASNADPDGTVIEPDTRPDINEARLREQPPPELDYDFVNADARFRARFPGKPRISSELVESESGKIEHHTFSYDYSITKAYWISFSEYPTGMVESKEPLEMLRGAMNSLASELGENTQLKDVEVKSCDYPCLFFKVRSGNFHGAYQLFMVENRLYQVGVVRDGKFPQLSDAEQFISSFEIIEGLPN